MKKRRKTKKLVKVSKFGGKNGARIAFYEFSNSEIKLTDKKGFLLLDL